MIMTTKRKVTVYLSQSQLDAAKRILAWAGLSSFSAWIGMQITHAEREISGPAVESNNLRLGQKRQQQQQQQHE